MLPVAEAQARVLAPLATLPPEWEHFEDAAVVSDAVLWLAEQPISHTGRIESITGLRERGIVRPVTKRSRD